MRKLFVLLSFVALIACNSSSNEKSDSSKKEDTPAASDNGMSAEEEKGMNLIAKSDCLTCHQIDAVSQGPSYTAVAAKYPKNEAVIDSLAEKIIKGGVGNWGTIPMIAHTGLSKEDARSMVQYVLSLKK